MASAVRIADGTYDSSGGVNSACVATVQSQSNPNGLPRQSLSWMTNCTVRDGGITQRTGFLYLLKLLNSGLYQGGYLYRPNFANPYLILSVSGRIYKVLVEAPYTITDYSALSGLTNPATVPLAHFEQGEEFLVIQAGDLSINNPPTLPLFWDGTTLRRSNGITGNLVGPNINELPAAGPMKYYQGRMWYAQGRIYTAGDIVDGPSGTAGPPYYKRDSILKVTENPLAIGGDGFTVPNDAGDITALDYTANLDTTLGQGPLYIFTQRQVYSLVVPVTRANWIAADAANRPIQTVAQIKWGSTGDRCVVHSNGDLYYQSLEPAIRSLLISIRYFQQFGNVAISRNENRLLQFNNRALMQYATGIQFDNRMLQAVLPVTTPVGVAFQGIAPLDFDIINQYPVGGSKLNPAWEGMWEGLDILQLFESDFGGLQRAFAMVHNRQSHAIEVWELTDYLKTDNYGTDENRVTWYFETPAFTWGKEFDMKVLDGLEMWIDSVSGIVDLRVEYRVDADPCWQLWDRAQFCTARNSCENTANPICEYPTVSQCEGYQFPVTLGTPEPGQSDSTMMKRPTTIGYQFQIRVTIKGWCRVRGEILFAIPRERAPFEGLNG